MHNSYNIATVVMTDYADRIVHGQEDEDEALQNAIDFALAERSDEFRSDLYTRVYSGWGCIELRFVRLARCIREAMNG